MSVRLSTLALALVLAACSGDSSEERIAAYAGGRLGVEPGTLRVTSQTELTGNRHRFHLVSREGLPLLVVVEPSSGELFDGKTPGAFDRVARAENATADLGQHGAERVASWFGALGNGACPMPASTNAHFAQTAPGEDGGVTIRYPAGAGKTCVVLLDADGGLESSRLVTTSTPQAQGPWRDVEN